MTGESGHSEPFGADAPEWVNDPDYIVFAGETPLVPGASAEHGLGDHFKGLFPRSKEQVKADWQQVVGQIRDILDKLPVDQPGFAMEEITFELGFSAQGKVVLIAEAGITATVSVTFKRREKKTE
jgi:hypothetical protein